MTNLEAILDLDNEILADLHRGILRALRFGDLETARRKREEMRRIEEDHEVLMRIWFRKVAQ